MSLLSRGYRPKKDHRLAQNLAKVDELAARLEAMREKEGNGVKMAFPVTS